VFEQLQSLPRVDVLGEHDVRPLGSVNVEDLQCDASRHDQRRRLGVVEQHGACPPRPSPRCSATTAWTRPCAGDRDPSGSWRADPQTLCGADEDTNVLDFLPDCGRDREHVAGAQAPAAFPSDREPHQGGSEPQDAPWGSKLRANGYTASDSVDQTRSRNAANFA
jgi:hypothetical protein